MKHLLAPSILSADFALLAEQINIVESNGADVIHLDVMDGHFVPNITFGPKMVGDVRKITKLPLDVHLMISEPEKYIVQFAKAGADWISVHYEASKHLNRLVQQIKDNGCKAGVVINPATTIDLLDDILSFVDHILIMSVNPGFGGQKFIKTTLEKSKKLSEKIENRKIDVLIEMDGGIGLENIKSVKDAGVNVFVCGNSIFSSIDIPGTIHEMKKILNQL